MWPIRENWRSEPRDGFPLSYYPMFSLKRSAKTRLTYMVGIDAEGGSHRIPYRHIGPGGLNQVRRQLPRAVLAGRGEEVCRAVAERLRARPTAVPADLVELRIVTGKFRLADYFSGEKRPASERIRCSLVLDE